MSNLAKKLRRWLAPQVPPQLAANFRSISPEQTDQLRQALARHYFTEDQPSLDTPEGQSGMEAHLHARMNGFRRGVIPWLNHHQPLRGARVLEIGCGTGSSTVALSEQGAQVTAIDIHEPSLEVARERCRHYGVEADFQIHNATEVHKALAGHKFDFLIFFATLEHMTHEERLDAIKSTWQMLPPGALWCVIDTPNRLWFFDDHTSFLPFFHWLPDDLAMKYLRFSDRQSINDRYHDDAPDTKLDFLRQGRGLSYHEFDLAIGNVEQLDVQPSLQQYLRSRSLAHKLRWLKSGKPRFEKFLRSVKPGLPPGFCENTLNLLIRKQ